MAEQIGFRLHIRKDARFRPPALLFLPKDPGILYSVTFATGTLWRGRSTTCLEIRATGLQVRSDNGIISFFVKQPDGIDRSLFSFVEKLVAGVTDLEDNDVIPETKTTGLFGKPDPHRYHISPLLKPLRR
jgi:hypothetical protein